MKCHNLSLSRITMKQPTACLRWLSHFHFEVVLWGSLCFCTVWNHLIPLEIFLAQIFTHQLTSAMECIWGIMQNMKVSLMWQPSPCPGLVVSQHEDGCHNNVFAPLDLLRKTRLIHSNDTVFLLPFSVRKMVLGKFSYDFFTWFYMEICGHVKVHPKKEAQTAIIIHCSTEKTVRRYFCVFQASLTSISMFLVSVTTIPILASILQAFVTTIPNT